MKPSRSLLGVCVCASAIAIAVSANALTIVTGTASGGRSAEADLSVSGSTLTIDLKNTGNIAMVNSDVLTALFFNLPSGVTLSTISAALGAGSSVVNGSLVHNVGEGWVYAGGISAHGDNAGISAAGFSVFGNTGFFYNPAVTPLDGADYGIVDGAAAGNHLNPGPQISNDVIFQLAISGSINLPNLANSLVFQWGTSLGEGSGGPNTPPSAPDGGTTILLLGMGLSGLGWMARRAKV